MTSERSGQLLKIPAQGATPSFYWKTALCWSALPLLSLVVFLVCAPGIALAKADFPVDDSFNIRAAYEKERKYRPYISIARQEPAEGVSVERNRVYRQIDDRALRLDLFRPGSGTSSPAVLLVHGGGWRSGNKTLQEPMATYLANQGFVTATVEYRLSMEAKYPAGVQDIKSALCWMHRNAEELGIDRQRIAILGASAGAQLATLVGVTPGLSVYSDGSDRECETIAAIVNIDGVVSFTTPMALKHENAPHKNPSAAGYWFGGTYEEVPDLWREASPLEYAGAGSPPTLFVNSSNPRFHAGRALYREQLRAAGVVTEVKTFPDTPHPFWLFDPWFEPAAEKVSDFLSKQLQ
ncbi:alpha/beta hydrolase [Microbulbifer sp.]|uniref:alpha/beta hydrolase n=1 Tax=Microbulbifer sp. TaxID=1908541 RepID=UPI00258389CD|nr:alpha/beta hydrolase [Microbulbifer sp.]